MTGMNGRSLWMGAVVFGLALSAVAPLEARTLNEAVALTLQTHPQINAIRANRRAIDQELRAFRGQYLPSIDGRAAVGHELSDNPTTRNRASREPGDRAGVSMNRYEAGITLRQMIFDGFGTDSEVNRQKGRVNSARFRVADNLEAIGLRAVEAYMEVQRTMELVALAERNLRVHRTILGRVVNRVDGGRSPESDVIQARARLAAAEAALAQTQGKLADARAKYRSTIGENPGTLQAATPPLAAVPATLDDAINTGLSSAPAIAARNADINSSVAAIGTAESNFYPRLDLEVAANTLHNIDGVRGRNADFSAMLVARYNFYRGGTDMARKREATERLSESRETLKVQQRDTVEQVEFSWNAMATSRDRIKALRTQVLADRQVVTAYNAQFDRGRRSLLDLLDVQNELFNTESSLTTEEYTNRFNVYRLLASMGMLIKTLGIEPPSEATKEPSNSVFSGD